MCSLARAKASCQGWDSVDSNYFDCLVIGSKSVGSVICQVTTGNLMMCLSYDSLKKNQLLKGRLYLIVVDVALLRVVVRNSE